MPAREQRGVQILRRVRDELVRAFEVLRARGRRARLEVAAERGLTPLVGREWELAMLLKLFQEVKAGRGQEVFVAGEAGIGKSRLLHEFRRALAQAGEEATWLEGRSISFGQAIPCLLVIDQLRTSFQIEELDGEPEIIAKVEHGMRRLGELEAHIPYIRYLLAGDRASNAFANLEAKGHYTRALEAAGKLTPSPDPGVLANLYTKQGAALFVLCEYDETAAAYRQALELYRSGGDRRREVRALLRLSNLYNFCHRTELATEYNEQALTLSGELNERALQAACLANRVWVRSAGAQIVETTPAAEEALRWCRQCSDYAFAAEDNYYIACVPNFIGGVHLELFDLDEAIRINLEADEVVRKVQPSPELRGHSLLKVGLAHLWRGEHGPAEAVFRQAWSLLEQETWWRWRWHIPLLRARGELALAEGRHEEAWSYAVQSLEMATQTDSRKHVARAQWLQGEILAASGRLEEGAQRLAESVRLAENMQTPREIWMGKVSLGKVLARMGKDQEAEAQLFQATQTIEAIAQKLQTPNLRQSFLGAEPVLEVYRVLGRRPPQTIP